MPPPICAFHGKHGDGLTVALSGNPVEVERRRAGAGPPELLSRIGLLHDLQVRQQLIARAGAA